MTDPTALATYSTVSESSIKDALIEARGDVFIAASLLGVTAIRIDRAIRVSPTLQATVAAIREASEGEYDKSAKDAIRAAVDRRTAIYQVEGLDALHALATMPIDPANSANNQVKLAAAARLAGPTEGSSGGGELAETLRALNDQYHSQALRLRVVREKTTVEVSPAERVVGQGLPE